MYHSRLLSLDTIKEQGLNIDPPPPDSFFFKAFNANIKAAKDTLSTTFIQGIKNGALCPDNFGAMTVLDAYYCYNGAKSLELALSHTDPKGEADLYTLLKQLYISYSEYNQAFLKVWHIEKSESVIPTATCKGYADYERKIANAYPPIYTLVVMLPCYYLWYWLSDQIYKSRVNNIYGYWIEGCHSANTAYSIGNFIESVKTFDEKIAMPIYQEAMNFEYKNFNEAGLPNELEAFFKGK